MLFLLSMILAVYAFAGVDLPNQSIIVTHPSRHYHVEESTIDYTNQILKTAKSQNRAVIALGQFQISTDSDWYSFPENFFDFFVYSHHGEHPLRPIHQDAVFSVTVMGGYHSACLGYTVSQLIAHFSDSELHIDLLTRGIFTGFAFKNGERYPYAPKDEAQADTSVKGLNLFEVTQSLNDSEWAAFMRESLRWAVFQTAPFLESKPDHWDIQIQRNGKMLIHIAPVNTDRRLIFNYRN